MSGKRGRNAVQRYRLPVETHECAACGKQVAIKWRFCARCSGLRSATATPKSRQQGLRNFVKVNDLACFRCGDRTPDEWAKAGVNKYGPWAICTSCVRLPQEGARA